MNKLPGARCDKCPLFKRPLVPGSGPPPGEAKFVIVGEAPGRTEAKDGVPFVGESGELLRTLLRHVGMDDTTGYYTNVATCHPPSNKLPLGAADCCKHRLAAELEPYWDSGVPFAALGVPAGNAMVPERAGRKSLRGHWYRDGRVVCTWHPAFILRETKRLYELVYDLQKLAVGKPREIAPVEHYVCKTIEEVVEHIDMLIRDYAGKVVCFDLETDQLLWWTDAILCMAFAYEDDKAFVIPGEFVYREELKEALIRLFDSEVLHMGHNLKFDLRAVRWQLEVPNVRADYDSLIAHYALHEVGYHALKPLVGDYLDIPNYELELVRKYLRSKEDFYSRVPDWSLMRYNALDTAYNLRLWHVLEAELKEKGLWERPFLFPMMAAHGSLVDMEMYGVKVDVPKLDWLHKQLGAGIVKLQAQLESACGKKFNANSWKRVSEIMYGHFRMPKVYDRGFKPGSTCKEAREILRRRLPTDHPGSQWLGLYGQLKSIIKLKSSYVDNIPDRVAPDYRIHADYLIYGTESGRLSARDPAIQTIPRPGTGNVLGDVWGKHIRSLFMAPKGSVLLGVDYSQAEMRVAAGLSKDPWLIKLYREGRDLHGEVALAMFGEDYTEEERNTCKKFNFAYLYGGTKHSFAIEAGLDIAVAERFVDQYQAMMTGLTQWRIDQFALMKKQGYVETVTGRRRRFPLITTDNSDEARKASVSQPVQGMACELTLISQIRVWEWLKEHPELKTHQVIFMHDELILEVPKKHLAVVARRVRQIMEDVGTEYFPVIPWVADCKMGHSWGELATYEIPEEVS